MSLTAGVTIINNRYALMPPPKPGGMSDVYRASDLAVGGRIVAVKFLRQPMATDALVRESFRRETDALRECRHTSIVELIEAGIDPVTGRGYLVLEWVEHNLEDWLASVPAMEWESFYERIGSPLLVALAFAHSKSLAHRDVTPKNILIAEDGTPKLADFGIAKLMRWTEPTVTLNAFASRPYCPPEADTGDYTYSRDVFGFAALSIRVLADVPLRDYDDLRNAIASARAPQEIRELFTRCLNEDPELRPLHAGILESEVRQIQSGRTYRDTLKRRVHVIANEKALYQVRKELGFSTNDAAEQAIAEDLNSGATLSLYYDKAGNISRYRLYATLRSYDVEVARKSKSHLLLMNAYRVSAMTIDGARQEAFSLHCDFRLGMPINPESARAALAELLESAERHEIERRTAEALRQEQHVFLGWINFLRAKTFVESLNERPLEYDQMKVHGDEAIFRLISVPDEPLVGQTRQVKRHRSVLLAGEVESLEGKLLTLRIHVRGDDTVPQTGTLVFDTALARLALERQWAALDTVLYLRATRPDLRRMIAFPETVAPPGSRPTFDPIQREIDEIKRNGIGTALASPDLLIVEGPPGTGKTTFITELILQTLRQQPDTRILVSSQTHVALDNVIERLQELAPEVNAIRVGRANDRRIAPCVQNLLIEKKLEEWRIHALAQGEQYLDKRAAVLGVSRHDLRIATLLRSLANARQRLSDDEERFGTLERSLAEVSDGIGAPGPRLDSLSVEERTLSDEVDHWKAIAANTRKEVRELEHELRQADAMGDELAHLSTPELENWAAGVYPESPVNQELAKLTDIYTSWTLQFGRGPEFAAVLLGSAQVIAATCVGLESWRGGEDVSFDLCIVDEASKATATELLVPMVRARRWVLVGDQQQLPPFVEDALRDTTVLDKYGLAKEDLENTLFRRLVKGLPEPCKISLLQQHRMVPAIGNLISKCFYDGRLQSAPKEWDRIFAPLFPKPVTWHTTASESNRWERTVGTSSLNTGEAQYILGLLTKMRQLAEKEKRVVRVGLLAGYGAQREYLQRLVRSKISPGALQIECNTVDAFQGRQVDVVIYSVTRSNRAGNLGFLGEARRLNVALSRARQYLVIVGDHVFCQNARGENPFKPVLEHISQHSAECQMSVARL